MVRLGDACEINPRPRRRPTPDEDVSFLPMSDVEVNGTTASGTLRPFRDVSSGYTLFERGDLLVAKITPCFENGKIAQAAPETAIAAGSTEFHVVRPISGASDSRYILHYLRHPHVRAAGERRMTGSGGQRRVPESYLRGLEVPFPPIEEQRRIAAVLDRAAELRAKRQAALALLDSLSESVFLDMFGDPLTHSALWPVGQIGDVVERFEAGKSIDTNDGDSDVASHWVLKVSAITSGRFLVGESKPVPPGYHPPQSHCVQRGDVLFSRANTEALVGASALVEGDPGNSLLSDKLWRFIWRKDADASPVYVWKYLQLPTTRGAIGALATGTSGSMKNISQAKLMSLPIPLPPAEVQRQFERRLGRVSRLRNAADRSSYQLDALFSSLQHRAFAGQL